MIGLELDPASFGRWRQSAEKVAERRAWLEAAAARAREQAQGRQLSIDWTAPCATCDDDGELDCPRCEGAGCKACDDTGRVDCHCYGGEADDLELDEDDLEDT